MRKLIRRNSIIFCLLLGLFFLPLLLRPKIFSGDEPHYLLVLNSLIRDHDLDLKNDYAAVAAGEDRAGGSFKKVTLDHHSYFALDGKIIAWDKIFDTVTFKPLDGTVSGNITKGSEVPYHSIFSTFLYIIPTAILGSIFTIETSAIVITEIFSLLGLYFFYKIAEIILSLKYRLGAVITVAMATPFWFYSKTLYSEILILVLLEIVLFLFLKKRLFILIGFICALLAGIKISFVVIPGVLFILLAKKKMFGKIVQAAAGSSLFIFIFIACNLVVYGVPAFFPVLNSASSEGLVSSLAAVPSRLFNLLFSLKFGLLTFSPVLVFSFAEMIFLAKNGKIKAEELLLILLGLATFGIYIVWPVWWGGYSFANRLTVPALPMFVLLAFKFLERTKSAEMRHVFYLFAVLAFSIQLFSVFSPPGIVTAQPPLILQLARMGK